MSEYFTAHMERAGTGLELLPGVRELLQALQVCGFSRGVCRKGVGYAVDFRQGQLLQ